MATDESSFKTGFRKDLKSAYKEKVLVWTNNDMYRIGLPDFSASFDSNLYSVEAKFIKTLPKKGTSKTLTHEVSDAQLQFLNNVRSTGNYASVLIGLEDVAVVMLELKTNYTLDEIRSARYIERKKGAWDVVGFFEYIRGDLK